MTFQQISIFDMKPYGWVFLDYKCLLMHERTHIGYSDMKITSERLCKCFSKKTVQTLMNTLNIINEKVPYKTMEENLFFLFQAHKMKRTDQKYFLLFDCLQLLRLTSGVFFFRFVLDLIEVEKLRIDVNSDFSGTKKFDSCLFDYINTIVQKSTEI